VLHRVYDRDDELVAVQYLVTGTIEITALHEETELVSAELLQIWNTVERGDVLFVSTIQSRQITPRPASVDLEARIMSHLETTRFMHEHDYIFINAGLDDGVEIGNRFIVWRRSDESAEAAASRTRRISYEEDVLPFLPWEVVGEALVIEATSEYTTAVVIDGANRELEDNMRVTLQRGF
jgi:hypothetical protein